MFVGEWVGLWAEYLSLFPLRCQANPCLYLAVDAGALMASSTLLTAASCFVCLLVCFSVSSVFSSCPLSKPVFIMLFKHPPHDMFLFAGNYMPFFPVEMKNNFSYSFTPFFFFKG